MFYLIIVKTWSFSTKARYKTKMSPLTIPFTYVLEVLATSMWEEKKTK